MQENFDHFIIHNFLAKIFFEAKEAVEVIEATEVIMSVEVIETAEIFRTTQGSKINKIMAKFSLHILLF